MWVMRVAIFVVGGMATYMALTIPTIYGLWSVKILNFCSITNLCICQGAVF